MSPSYCALRFSSPFFNEGTFALAHRCLPGPLCARITGLCLRLSLGKFMQVWIEMFRSWSWDRVRMQRQRTAI